MKQNLLKCRRAGRPIGRLAGILAVFVVLTSCDMALYNPDAVEAARRAEDFTFVTRAEYSGWDYSGYDGDRLTVPTGFYPDDLGAATGYLVFQEFFQLRIWRLHDGAISGMVDIHFDYGSAHGDWDAWIAPLDPAAANPTGYPPPLLVATWGDHQRVNLDIVTFDPGTTSLHTTSMDIVTQAKLAATNADTVYSVNAVTFGPASVRQGGTPVGSTGIDLSMLVRDTNELQEVVFRGTGLDFINWAKGTQFTIAAITTPGPTTNQFSPPLRSDGDSPVGIRHATDFSTYTGVLSFRDGDWSSAPYRVYTWPSTISSLPFIQATPFSPSGRISSITYDGTLRSGRNGTVTVVGNLDGTPSTGKEENSTFWYAGQYPDGAAPLKDVYTHTGVSRVSDGDGIITVGVYTR